MIIKKQILNTVRSDKKLVVSGLKKHPNDGSLGSSCSARRFAQRRLASSFKKKRRHKRVNDQ